MWACYSQHFISNAEITHFQSVIGQPNFCHKQFQSRTDLVLLICCALNLGLNFSNQCEKLLFAMICLDYRVQNNF